MGRTLDFDSDVFNVFRAGEIEFYVSFDVVQVCVRSSPMQRQRDRHIGIPRDNFG